MFERSLLSERSRWQVVVIVAKVTCNQVYKDPTSSIGNIETNTSFNRELQVLLCWCSGQSQPEVDVFKLVNIRKLIQISSYRIMPLRQLFLLLIIVPSEKLLIIVGIYQQYQVRIFTSPRPVRSNWHQNLPFYPFQTLARFWLAWHQRSQEHSSGCLMWLGLVRRDRAPISNIHHLLCRWGQRFG